MTDPRGEALITGALGSVSSAEVAEAEGGSRLLTALLDTYDYVWRRLRRRVEGLTDEEYLWEPVPGCWTVRLAGEGRYRADSGVWPETAPSPVTTIAWRMCHIADNFMEERIGKLFGRSSGATPPGHPSRAVDGIAYAEHAYLAWRDHLRSSIETDLWRPLPDGLTPYTGQPLLRFVLQYLEEFAHHAAEVGVLRDLYRDDPSLRRRHRPA